MRGSGQNLPGGCCVKERLLLFVGEGQAAAEHAGWCMLQTLNGVRMPGKAQEGMLKSDKRGTPGRMYGASSVSAMKPYSHVCTTTTRLQSLASSGVEIAQMTSAGCPRGVCVLGTGLTTSHC